MRKKVSNSKIRNNLRGVQNLRCLKIKKVKKKKKEDLRNWRVNKQTVISYPNSDFCIGVILRKIAFLLREYITETERIIVIFSIRFYTRLPHFFKNQQSLWKGRRDTLPKSKRKIKQRYLYTGCSMKRCRKINRMLENIMLLLVIAIA